MAAPCRSPLVVILGATGTGKTKLSLELARLFNGEIISADSMQVYKGLDIITNKVTPEEQRQCPHHMINMISPLVQNANIVAFRNKALPIIDSLLAQKKTPIIVGGTNYYIEALLWKLLLPEKTGKTSSSLEKNQQANSEPVRKTSEQKKVRLNKGDVDNTLLSNASKGDCDTHTEENNGSGSDSSSESEGEQDFRQRLQEMYPKELHSMLKEVDSVTAHRLHPTETRRIIRALEVYHQHGVPMSNLYKAQHAETQTEKAVSGPLRYTDTCIFWIQCDQQVLDTRLNKRVDGMLAQGLVKELTDFHTQYNADRIKEGSKADYTRGIFQSIGFKEFHDYLILSEEEKQTDKGRQLLEKGIEELKLVTRRYARQQIKWIRNRFLKRPGGNVPSVYALDGSDVSRWDELVTKPATEILQALRLDQEPAIQALPFEGERDTVYTYNECEICDKVFVIERSWKAHLAGRKHKGLLRRAKILERRKREELIKLTQTLDQVVASGKHEEDETVSSREKQDINVDTGENS